MRGRLDPAQLDDRIEQLGAPLDRRRPVLAALSVAITLLLVVGLFAAVRDGADVRDADEASVSVAGEVLVRRAGDGEVRRLADGSTVSSGDEIEVVDGTVVLSLADGTTLEGRAATNTPPTELRFGSAPSLQRGELLVAAPAGYVVEAAGTMIALDDDEPSVARLRATLQVEVAAYQGLLHVDSAGRTRDVPTLRQLTVSSLGRPASTPEPLGYESDDPWDRRYLGAAIDLGQRLASFERAVTAVVPPATAAAPETYRRLLPSLNAQPDFGPRLLGSARPAGEVLVGAAIAARSQAGSFAARWEDTFAFRDARAEWGLVALDQGADFDAVVGDIEAAIAIATAPLVELALPPPPVPLPQPPGPVDEPAPTPADNGVSDDSPAATAPPPPPEVPVAPTTPPPVPAPTVLPPVAVPLPPLALPPNLLGNLIEPVDDLIGVVLGG